MTISAYLCPFETWASMPQTLWAEDWPAKDRPGSVAYFCGALDATWPTADVRGELAQAEAGRANNTVHVTEGGKRLAHPRHRCRNRWSISPTTPRGHAVFGHRGQECQDPITSGNSLSYTLTRRPGRSGRNRVCAVLGSDLLAQRGCLVAGFLQPGPQALDVVEQQLLLGAQHFDAGINRSRVDSP